MKECYTCKESKPLSDFGKHNKYKSGLNNHCFKCNAKRKLPDSQRSRGKAKNLLDPLGCAACDFNHENAKEVHHLSSDYKRFGRSQDIKYNVEDINLGYAIVLCPNCHSLFHGAHGGKNKKFPLYTKEQTIEIIKNERLK